MALYDFKCGVCGKVEEFLNREGAETSRCCNSNMERLPSCPSIIRVQGLGLPSRRKWMDNWTPESPPISTGSLHGERY